MNRVGEYRIRVHDMDKKIRTVLVEDHTILREGLRALLSADPKFQIVGEADDGRQAIRRVDNLAPDLVVMDYEMPNMGGAEALARLRDAGFSAPVLLWLLVPDGWRSSQNLFLGGAAAVTVVGNRLQGIALVQYIVDNEHRAASQRDA